METPSVISPPKPPGLPTAWEPLTPKGVAAFANARVGRLFIVQFVIASLAAAVLATFISHGWFPVIRDAIHQLPAGGAIRGGRLAWTTNSPVQLAQNQFLGIAVDLFHSGSLGRESHLQVELGDDDFRVYSLFGYTVNQYPLDWNLPLNQTDMEPWWGAWQPMLLVSAMLLTVAGLMISWFCLATLYCLPVWLIGFFQNRDLGLLQSWRLAGASLMPGALFLTFGMTAYSLKWIDLIQLGGMFAMHFAIVWIYLVISPLFCPKAELTLKTRQTPNPFVPSAAPAEDAATPKVKKGNPFGTG